MPDASPPAAAAAPWWRTAVGYQVYPRAFADASGDGVGDLPGLRSRLDHLSWLGVDAVWLSPVYPSPQHDMGYDVADHCDVDPTFGTLADLDGLVADAHDLGLKVMLDWVPNHTSDQHPWFRDSRSSPGSPRRSWYWWRDGRDGGPPNDWQAAFGTGPAWTYDEASGQWYLHLFLPEQPDLNWHEPAVEQAMHDVLRFWLDRGVDGFRADVVHLIGKDPQLADRPADEADRLITVLDEPGTHPLLRRIRKVLDAYDGDRAMIGEITLYDPERLAAYYGDGDELHLVFNFTLIAQPFDAASWRQAVERTEATVGRAGWPAWALANHDVWRTRSRLGGSEARARLAAVVLLTLRGTPFIYAGEELGLPNAEVPDHLRVDPAGRDVARAPIPWTAEQLHGWAGRPALPFPPEAEERNVAAQRADADSTLHLHRRLIAARSASAALTLGSWEALDAPDGVLAYRRAHGDDQRVVAACFAEQPADLDGLDGWRVEVATDRRLEGEAFTGRLGAEAAVVLAPPG